MESNSFQQQPQYSIKLRRDEIAHRWFQEITLMSYSPDEGQHILAQFREMTSQVISLLFHPEFDSEKARGIGTWLAKLHDNQAEVLGRSQKILTELFLQSLPSDDIKSILPQFTLIISEIANGFINEAHRMVLKEQKSIRDELINEIDEHKRTQTSLQESEEKWRSLVHNAPERIMTLDQDGIIQFTNRTYPHRTIEEVIGTNLFKYLDPKIKNKVEQALNAVFLERKSTKHSITFKNSKGENITFENSFAPIIHNGEVKQAILVATDISEQERAVNSLITSQENFSALAENANDGILITDFNGDYVYSNKRYTEITGYSSKELKDMNLISIASEGEREKFRNWSQQALSGSDVSEQFVTHLINKQNQNIPVEVTSAITTWKGEPTALSIVRDISERIRAEEALKHRSEEIALLHEQLRAQRVEEQTALLNFSQSLLGETDKEIVLNIATNTLCEIFKANYCDIILLNECGDTLQFEAGRNWRSNLIDQVEISTTSKSQVGFTLKSNEPVIVEDISLETRFAPLLLYVSHGIESSLSVRMVFQDKIIGVMGIHWDIPRKIPDGEVRMLPLIANTTSATLDRVRLFESEQKRSQSLNRTIELITALNQTGTRLAITMYPEQVLETVRLELKKLGLSCAAFLFNEDKLEIAQLFSSLEPGMLDQTTKKTGINLHDPQLLRQLLKKFFGDILNTGKPKFIKQQIIDHIVENTHPDKSKIEAALTLVGLTSESSSMWLPLIIKNHVIGTLGLWGEGLKHEDLPVVNVFASQVATALENAQLFDQIVHSRKRMRDLSNQLVQVQEIERRRIARELHDEIGQSLTGLSLMLNSLYNPDEKKTEQYQKTQSLVEELIGKTQDLSLGLRPAMLDEMGLLPTLLWFFRRYENQTGIHINFEHKGLNQRFSSPLETTAYRIVQEGLTNIARHAGVEQADVRVWTDQESVSIQIEDQGIGFNLEEHREQGAEHGLIGMNERATLIGGEFDVASTLGSGTTMYVTLPIQYDHEGEAYEL